MTREDPLRGWLSVSAPTRGRRPVDFSFDGEADACPFCPGAESELAEILQEWPGRENRPWGARAVRNRFPFLRDGEGHQEVLVDTSRHGVRFHELSPVEVEDALRLYRARARVHHGRNPGWEVHLFRNDGRDAGATRAHAHGQLVALPGPTPARAELERRLCRAMEDNGGCALCHPGSPDHAVYLDEHWAIGTVPASLDPCHCRIVPRRHTSSIAECDDEALDGLSLLLVHLVPAVLSVSGAQAYNLLFHDHGSTADPSLHWHVELRPRVGRTAGFEQSSGMGVCPSDPVLDAKRLRASLDGRLTPS